MPRPTQTGRAANAPKKSRSLKASLPPPTPSEAAFERALAALGEPRPADESPVDAFVERVFAKASEYLYDRYATIGDATTFHSKIAGVSFEGRQDVIAGLRTGSALELVRQPDNPHDPNAIAISYGNLHLGFINRKIAAHLAPLIDGGARYRARIASITGAPRLAQGGSDQRYRGVNIFVERDVVASVIESDRRHLGLRTVAARDARRDESDRVREALIGSAFPHDAQRAVLERVDEGLNTLAVLGTGRGKSFCFQYTAAVRAFAGGGKTLVIYPLRALANDQYEALMRRLDPLGLRIYRANGSIANDEREDLFEALREGTWDVVLATPEFLDFHREAFRGRSKPSLVVVDEAHHVYESRHRAAYGRLGATIAELGAPQILALTATAADEAFRKILEELHVKAWVVDPTVRENLHVVDARNCKEKVEYLAELFTGEKGIIYCNSRKDANDVAGALRKRIGNDVMFYHAGMPTPDRHEVERLFREGELRVVVATSAFGEGIDLPDVRHVVLFHLNFDFAEFNQQAGRAGRDGAPAQIHLLYGESDRRLNEYLIDLEAPTLPMLRSIYRGMKAIAHEGALHSGNADLAATLDLDKVRDRTVGAALRIFVDAGLVEISEDDGGRAIRFLPVDGKIDMERNERFAEGEAIRDSFDRFCTLALGASAETLERIINRPIYPAHIDLLR